MRKLTVALVTIVGLFIIGIIAILNNRSNNSDNPVTTPATNNLSVSGPSIDVTNVQFNPNIAPQSYGVALEQIALTVEVDQGVARIEIRERLRNVGSGRQEVEFIFPLPDKALIEDFTLRDGDTILKAQVLDATQARSIYNSIVSQMRDPGLLEYIGRGAIRIAAFPFDPNQSRELRFQYRQPLVQDQGFYRLNVPIKALNRMPGIIRPMHYSARVISDIPYIPPYYKGVNIVISAAVKDSRTISGLYSPSHGISFRTEKGFLKGSFEATHPEILDNFVLNYRTSGSKGIDGSFIAYPSGANSGFFMLQIDPGQNNTTKIQPKDVVFVIDTSGSMMGDKIVQARQAIKSVLGTLNNEDRYSIIEFSDIASAWYDSLIPADISRIRKDQDRAQMIQAAGGTNIGEALSLAGKILRQSAKSRARYILFATDGMPTVGESDPARLVSIMRENIPANVRLYAFGVGTDVNANLLDELSLDHRGSAVYMGPQDNMELQISAFARMLRAPYIVDPSFKFTNLKIANLLPEPTPDLYAETITFLYGRYQGQLPRSVGLNIHSSTGKTLELTCPVQNSASNSFIAKLWAGQRVAYLLRKLQLKGEDPGMVREITQLATEYGIVTPYTSYLITEGNLMDAERQEEMVRAQAGRLNEAKSGSLANLAARARQAFGNNQPPPGGGPGGSGGPGPSPSNTDMAKDVASELGIDTDTNQVMQNRAGIAFYQQNKTWVDGRINSKTKARIVKLNVFSEEAQKIIESSETVRNAIDLVNFQILINDQLIIEFTDADQTTTKHDLDFLHKNLK